MQTLIGFVMLIALGWLIVAILPVVLPVLGYLVAGVVGVYIFGALFGK